jgi:hypothetical protein
MTDIASMLARVRQATRPDREIDGLLCGMLNGYERNDGTFLIEIYGEESFQFRHPTKMHPNGPAALYVKGSTVPAYTESIDAIVALIEAKLPGWTWSVVSLKYDPSDQEAKPWADIEGGEDGYAESYGATICVALTCAFLQARESVK